MKINDIPVTALDLEKYPVLAPLFELKTKYTANEAMIKSIALKVHPGSEKVSAGEIRRIFNDEKVQPPADRLNVVRAANTLVEEQDKLVVLRARDINSANDAIVRIYEMIAAKTELLKDFEPMMDDKKEPNVDEEETFGEVDELINFDKEEEDDDGSPR